MPLVLCLSDPSVLCRTDPPAGGLWSSSALQRLSQVGLGQVGRVEPVWGVDGAKVGVEPGGKTARCRLVSVVARIDGALVELFDAGFFTSFPSAWPDPEFTLLLVHAGACGLFRSPQRLARALEDGCRRPAGAPTPRRLTV